MLIVGNGLLASEFKKNDINDDVVIIASGVSNSKEDSEIEFMREELLIKDILFKYKRMKIVYFSTCSILQSEHTPYIRHKIKMEEIIIKSDVRHYIFRLPQVVGIVNNNTLISYLIRNSYLNNSLMINENAFRNLLDIEDIVRIVKKILEFDNSPTGIALNIASSSYIRVLNIAEKIKSILQSESKIIVVPGGEKYYIENSHLKRYIGEKDIIFSDKYAIDVIEKYTNRIKVEFSYQWDDCL